MVGFWEAAIWPAIIGRQSNTRIPAPAGEMTARIWQDKKPHTMQLEHFHDER